MGGPIDARQNPTAVNRFCHRQRYVVRGRNMSPSVPRQSLDGTWSRGLPGIPPARGVRLDEPGAPREAYRTYWYDQLRGTEAAPATQDHERF